MDAINPLHVDFYNQQEDGSYQLKEPVRHGGGEYIQQRVSPGGYLAHAELAAQAEQWDWFDEHCAWLKDEPTPPEQAEISILPDEPNPWDSYRAAFETWQANEPQRPAVRTGQQFMDDELVKAPEYQRYLKLKGIEFEGVMVSAHKEDQWGLASLESAIKAGNTVRGYEFKNGNTLDITPENYERILAVFIPFRQSFFGQE